MNEKLLTIFSPVYNRSDKIKNLYQSLVEQTNRDFIWMVVDDGSKDDIDEVIGSFIEENKLEIQYYKQENQGKHVAHNFGVAHCNTQYFLVLIQMMCFFQVQLKKSMSLLIKTALHWLMSQFLGFWHIEGIL